MPSTEPARGEPRRARDRALANVLRMGHCAPELFDEAVAAAMARYVATGCVARCEELARAVADEARAAIGRTRGARTAA